MSSTSFAAYLVDLGTMIYTFARVCAVLNMTTGDYYLLGKRS